MKTKNDIYQIQNIGFLDAGYSSGEMILFFKGTNSFYLYDFLHSRLKNIFADNLDKINIDLVRKIIRREKDIFLIQLEPCIIFHFIYEELKICYVESIDIKGFEGAVKNAFYCNDSIWIIPMEGSKSIYTYNIGRKKIENIGALAKRQEDKSIIRDIVFRYPYLYIHYANSREICCVDVVKLTKKQIVIDLDDNIEGFNILNNELIIRLSKGKSVFAWDIDTAKLRKLADANREYEELGKIRILESGEIIICPVCSDDFCYIDEEQKSIKDIVKRNTINRISEGTYTIETVEYAGGLYILPWAGANLTEIRKCDGVIEVAQVPFFMEKEEYIKYLKLRSVLENIIGESSEIGLQEYIKLV